MVEFNDTETVTNWNKWKTTLAKAVNIGEAIGMSDETIEKVGYRVGNVLSAVVDPENREQRVLQELWKAGDDQDRRYLSKMIVKMVERDVKQ